MEKEFHFHISYKDELNGENRQLEYILFSS